MLHNEKDVLLRISFGDEQAFTELYNVYQPLLSTHIFRITNSKPLTDEIVQDVFLKIWIHRDQLSAVHNFKAYMGTVSRNYALNEVRRLSTEKMRHQQWQKEQLTAVCTDNGEASILSREDILLDSAIGKLPPQQKKAYILSRHQRLKYAEIAEKLHLTRGTVKRYLQLATESITKHLQAQSIKDVMKMLFLISLNP